jgi:hypothetical protein
VGKSISFAHQPNWYFIPVSVEAMIVAAPRFQYPGSSGVLSLKTAGTALVVNVSARVSKARKARQSNTAGRSTVSVEVVKAFRSQGRGSWARLS